MYQHYAFELPCEGTTIFGRTFLFYIKGIVEVVYENEFHKTGIPDQPGKLCGYHPISIEYYENVFSYEMIGHFWLIDAPLSRNSPALYKLVKTGQEQRAVRVGSYEIVSKLRGRKGPTVSGARVLEITDLGIIDSEKWINRSENMISQEDRQYFIDNLGYLGHLENYYLSLEQEAKKKFKVNQYGAGKIRIVTVQLSDSLKIDWENKEDDDGALKIFRREGSFHSDKWSEENNGILIIDSFQKTGSSIDYLEKGKDYFYTVLYKYPKGLINVRYELSHIARFSVRIQPEEGLLKDKGEIERFRKETEIDQEKYRIKAKHDIEKEAIELQADKERVKRLLEEKNKAISDIRKTIVNLPKEEQEDILQSVGERYDFQINALRLKRR